MIKSQTAIPERHVTAHEISKSRATTIEEIKEEVLPILQRHWDRRAGLFGSLVRGELRKSSDIDILVEMNIGLSLLDVVAIQQELEDALGRKVDLVEYEAIKPTVKDNILAQEVRLL